MSILYYACSLSRRNSRSSVVGALVGGARSAAAAAAAGAAQEQKQRQREVVDPDREQRDRERAREQVCEEEG